MLWLPWCQYEYVRRGHCWCSLRDTFHWPLLPVCVCGACILFSSRSIYCGWSRWPGTSPDGTAFTIASPILLDPLVVLWHLRQIWRVCIWGNLWQRGGSLSGHRLQAGHWYRPRIIKDLGLSPVAHRRWHLLELTCNHQVGLAAFCVQRRILSTPGSLLWLHRSSVCRGRWWGTWSNTFEKSNRTTSTLSFPEWRLLAVPWMVATSWVTVNRFFLKPCCFTVSMLLWSKCLMMLLWTCLSTLDATDVSDTGLYLEASCFGPFL